MKMSRFEALAESPFSLSLSSGFLGYFAHLGFVCALEERGLRPSSISGSSSGALVAAGLASGKTAQELKGLFLGIEKKDFWDPALGFGFLKGQKMERLLADHYAKNFSETQIPLHISVFNIWRAKTEVVTEGLVAKACRASAAVPLFFHPVKLNRWYFWDGGIMDRAGHKGVRENGQIPVIHYLHSKDWLGRFEDRFFYSHLHKSPFFFKTPSPHKVGPDYLDKGSEVLMHFQKEARRWLETEFKI